jgi:hypothetical protein
MTDRAKSFVLDTRNYFVEVTFSTMFISNANATIAVKNVVFHLDNFCKI